MGKRRTLKQYRTADLCMFALMLAVFESIIVTASVRWFPGEPYTVSLTCLITAIVMIRWGPWAGIHAVLGGLILCAESGAAPSQYAIYCLGNLFSLAALAVIRGMGGPEAVRGSSGKTLGYGLAVLLLAQLGRAAVSLAFGAGPARAAGFLTTEVVTDLFTLVILWIVRRLDGILEDQHHYLLRVQEEEKSNSGS